MKKLKKRQGEGHLSKVRYKSLCKSKRNVRKALTSKELRFEGKNKNNKKVFQAMFRERKKKKNKKNVHVNTTEKKQDFYSTWDCQFQNTWFS